MKIPKFRVASRVNSWLEKHGTGSLPNGRMPSDREGVFFKGKEDDCIIADQVAEYASHVGPLELRFEKLMVGHPNAAYNYLRTVWYAKSNNPELELNPELLNTLKGQGYFLLAWSQVTGERLPTELEDTFKDAEPQYAYEYAKKILCGRLPEHIEDVFFKCEVYAARYAFDVIRGFASVRLPEALHNFMLLKSYEDNNGWVKSYVEASENDPNKIGNRSGI